MTKSLWVALALLMVGLFFLGFWLGLLFRITHIKETIQQDPSQCNAVEMTLNGQSYTAPAGYGWYLCPEITTQSV